MSLPELDERLGTVASLVRPGSFLADIGTDHGYLPVYLVGSGICPAALACDVNVLPLKKAEEEIKRNALENQIKTRLTNGLEGLENFPIDDIVIAGMGGELIWKILSAAEWTQNPVKRLVLQPMTKADFLRTALYKNGFEIIQEQAVRHRGRLYTVMLAAYTGKHRQIGSLFSLVGRLPECHTAAAENYILTQAQKLERKAAGLEKAERQAQSPRQLRDLAAQLYRVVQEKITVEEQK